MAVKIVHISALENFNFTFVVRGGIAVNHEYLDRDYYVACGFWEMEKEGILAPPVLYRGSASKSINFVIKMSAQHPAAGNIITEIIIPGYISRRL